MTVTRNIAKAGLGLLAGASSISIAYVLGSGEALVTGANAPLLIAGGLVGGALLHLPAHIIWSMIESAADGIEGQVEAIASNGRPSGNEDAERAGFKAAVLGVRYAATHYAKAAKVDMGEHDLKLAKKFRRGVCQWAERNIAAASRKDRPEHSVWAREGLSLEAVAYSPDGKTADPRGAELEQLAWLEFTEAMKMAKVEIPDGFHAHFTGQSHCGPGWRRAGHLYFVRELKRNHDAYVGFSLEENMRTQAMLREILHRLPPTPAAPVLRGQEESLLSAQAWKRKPAGPWAWNWRGDR